MKLLRIISSIAPKSGGPAEGIRQITPVLEKYGVKTTIITLDPPQSSWLKSFPGNVISLGPAYSNYYFKINLHKQIREIAKKNDFIIIEGLWQYHSLATWRALKTHKIPYYIYSHGMLDPWFKYKYPLKHIKKSIYWLFFESHVINDSKGILFTTTQECNLAKNTFNPYKPKEYIVGYGTAKPKGNKNDQIISFIDKFPKLKNKRLILFLGRIHQKKGIDLLINAFSRIESKDKKLHLVIAGPSEKKYKNSLIKLIKDLGLVEKVTWTGMLSGDLKFGAIYSAELFSLPSHQENFGVAVTEALSCGVPVAISTEVNISSQIKKYKAGIVKIDSIKETTDGLNEWLELSPEQKEEMSKNALSLFKNKFDIEEVSKRLLNTLNKN